MQYHPISPTLYLEFIIIFGVLYGQSTSKHFTEPNTLPHFYMPVLYLLVS